MNCGKHCCIPLDIIILCTFVDISATIRMSVLLLNLLLLLSIITHGVNSGMLSINSIYPQHDSWCSTSLNSIPVLQMVSELHSQLLNSRTGNSSLQPQSDVCDLSSQIANACSWVPLLSERPIGSLSTSLDSSERTEIWREKENKYKKKDSKASILVSQNENGQYRRRSSKDSVLFH